MEPAIDTRHLCKVFGNKTAVEDLTLTVGRGEVFGFLGPNGAGKTTSVKMLLDLIRPTSGEGYLFGKPIGDTTVRQRIGYLPEHFRFHDWLSGNEFLKLHSDLYGMPRQKSAKQISSRIDELLEMVELSEHASNRLRTYSKGMLQRIGLAQALLNDPDLVILDEPTSGLDPVGRRLVRDIIRQLSEKDTTVFLNSHLLSEVEITCHRVAFIKHGRIIQTSQLNTLIERELSVRIRTRGLNGEIVAGLEIWSKNIRVDATGTSMEKRQDLEQLDHSGGKQIRGGELLQLTLSKEEDIPEVTRYLVEHGVDIFEVDPLNISLEDLFIQIVGTDGGL